MVKYYDCSRIHTGETEDDFEQWVKQTIDAALVSEKIVDIFGAAGIKKPDLSVLSDELMAEMRDYQYKNIALKTLKKLLSEEVKVRERRNKVESKRLFDLLQAAINNGYHNKVKTAAEVVEELIQLAKSIQVSNQLANELNLTEYEYAFYSTISANDSAKELMQKNPVRISSGAHRSNS